MTALRLCGPIIWGDEPLASALSEASWSFPTTIRLGAAALEQAGDCCRQSQIERPLVVTDAVLAQESFVARLEGVLTDAGLHPARYAPPAGEPDPRSVQAGIDVLRQGQHDGIVAIGGGSSLDLGKLIAFAAVQSRPLSDFEDREDWWQRAERRGIVPIIAIPTTAGTGSEVGRAAVLTDREARLKRIIFHPDMLPRAAILDPELTLDLPQDLTAYTGLDALSHCLEAYCARGFHPMAEGIAVEGLRLIRHALPRAHANGRDLEARGAMLTAASMGAVAFQKGLGLVHALSHPIGAHYGTHHGLTNAVLLPYVLTFNRPAIQARFERLAAWLELPRSDFTAVFDWIIQLRREFGIPRSLEELGVPGHDLETLVDKALDDPAGFGNPITAGRESLLRLLEDAWHGHELQPAAI